MPSSEPLPRAAPWNGALTMGAGVVGFHGPGGDAERHAHYAVQLVVSFDEPFVLDAGPPAAGPRRLAVVPSGRPHRLQCRSERILLLLVEPNGLRARALHALAEHATSGELERTLVPVLRSSAQTESLAGVLDALDRVVGHDASARRTVPSEPVLAALHYLDRRAHAKPRLAEAAVAAHLSPSHLTHLFTREVGIPFRRYAVWARLRRAVEAVADGANLTEAAAEASFSDSAHLSRVFKANFGLPPSALLRMRIDESAWPARP